MLTKKELATISILRFISRTNFMLVSELSMKKVLKSGGQIPHSARGLIKEEYLMIILG